MDPRRNTLRHIIITLPKIKVKERILKAAREKEVLTYKGVPIKLSTTEPKKKHKKQKKTKQTTRRGTESQKWRSQGGSSEGRRSGENGGKGTGNKKHKW